MFIKKKFFLFALFLIFFSSALYPQQSKKLTIKGLRVFSEEELFKQLQLKRFEEGKKPLAEVITLIEKFYKKRNYTLVKVYSTEVRVRGEYTLFVDEGRLGRIIVHNLNNYYSLKFKQQIDIPDRVYNTEVIAQNLKNLSTKFPASDIRIEIQQPPDYQGNLIQLDRDLQRLKLGEIIDITFFDRYVPVNDLHFFVTGRSSNGNGNGLFAKKNEGIGYDIHYKFSSMFIPEIYYKNENMLAEKDYFESTLSVGLDPGLGGLFKIPPANTFLFPPVVRFTELTGEYKISPMKNDFIGPLLRGRIFHSEASRPDLGITSYRYLNTRGTVAPEFTLLKNLNIYAGFGVEQVIIYRSKVDETAERHLDTSDDIYRNTFGEARLKFDPIPIRIGNRIDKFLIFTYTDYISGNSSNKIELQGVYDTEFDNLSILSLKSKTVLMYRDPPFYLSESVNNQYFKGFSGKSYYTNKKISASCEYRFSIYLDYIYAGAFVDLVLFAPEGYIISGTKSGINMGPTARVLIYDQFEFIIYFGFDRLFPDNKAGTNLQMKLTKKW